MTTNKEQKKEIQELGYAKSEIEKYYPTLF